MGKSFRELRAPQHGNVKVHATAPVEGFRVLRVPATLLLLTGSLLAAGLEPPTVRTILCVGDSFSGGAGPDGLQHSYPSILERSLEAEQPGRFRIAVRRYPASDSREILLDLENALAAERPSRVYLLIGINDRHHLPDALSLEELRELRSSNEVQDAKDDEEPVGPDAIAPEDPLANAGEPSVDDPMPVNDPMTVASDSAADPTGTWHIGAERVEFVADGVLRTRFGTFEWERDATGTHLQIRAAGIVAEVRATIAEDRLILRRIDGSLIASLDAGEPTAEVEQVSLGERRAAFEKNPNWIAALWLARAEVAAGEIENAASHCAWILAVNPRNYFALDLLGKLTREPGLRPRALAGMHAAHTDLAATDPNKPVIARLEAFFRVPDAPVERAGLLIDAFVLDRDWRETLLAFARDPALDSAVVDAALREASLDDSLVAEVMRIHGEVATREERIARVLAAHYELAAKLCEEAGAKLVVMSYPRPQPDVDAGRSLFVSRGSPEFLDVAAAFGRIPPVESDALFVLDGHLSAAGQEILANIVKDDVLAAFRDER